MRFVEVKTEDQQAQAVLFRARERLVHQRTDLINALRAILCEYGHVFPQGPAGLKRIQAVIDAEHSDLPDLVRAECRDLLVQIAEKTTRLDAKTKTAKTLAQQDSAARENIFRRMQTMPGVGPMTALALEAFAPPMESFRRGRDFAAWR